MAVTGKISFGFFDPTNYPTGEVVLIGADGQHYQIGQTSTGVTGYPYRVGWVEANGGFGGPLSIIKNISAAQWRADLASLGMGQTGTFSEQHPIPLKGTKYFAIAGNNPNWTPDFQWAWVYYAVNSPTDVQIVGGVLLVGQGSRVPNGYSVGSNVLNGNVYLFVESGYGNPAFTFETWLFQIPFAEGTLVDLTANSTFLYGTRIGIYGANHQFSWNSVQGFVDSNGTTHVSIIPVGTNIGLIRYISQPAASAVWYLEVDPNAAQPGGGIPRTINPADITNLSASFGAPFADAGFNFANVFTGTAADDYTGPSVYVLSDGSSELTFCRSFSDDEHRVRLRRFLMNGPGSVTSLGVTDFVHNADTFFATPEIVQSFREGSDLVVGLRDVFRVIYGSVSVPLPPTTLGRRWFAEPGPIRSIA
jgi:hypothetical protein